jgi:hypothetical protein
MIEHTGGVVKIVMVPRQLLPRQLTTSVVCPACEGSRLKRTLVMWQLFDPCEICHGRGSLDIPYPKKMRILYGEHTPAA